MSEEKEEVTSEIKEKEEPNLSVSVNSWWGSWVNTARLKSSEVLEFVKKDLNEITSVVKSEASSVVQSTTSALKETLKLDETDSTANSVKRSVSSFLGSVSNVLNPLPDDEDEEAIVIQSDGPIPLSRLQTRLHSLIINKDTYLTDVEEEHQVQFKSWCDIAEDQLTTDKLTKHLMSSSELHEQYESLVPEEVSHINFWKRFLFRKAMLEDEESKREAKEKREKRQADQVQWDKEDFVEKLEISEEEQIRLLTEYEKERKQVEPEVIMKDKRDMVIVSDTVSSQVSSSSDGKDTDEWEELEDSQQQ